MVKKIISIVLIIVLQLTMIPGALASQKNVATAEFGYALKIDGFENAEMATEAGEIKEFKDWKYCWVLDRSQDHKKATINLKFSDDFKSVSDFDGSVYDIEIEYYDTYINSFFFVYYDSVDSSKKLAETVYTKNTRKWKTVTFTLDDALFNRRLNGEYDLAISLIGPQSAGFNNLNIGENSNYIRTVKVTRRDTKNVLRATASVTAPGNSYRWYADKKEVTAYLKNVSKETITATIQYNLINEETNEILWTKEETKTVNPGVTSRTKLDFGSVKECGLFRLEADITTASGEKINTQIPARIAIIKADENGMKNKDTAYTGRFHLYSEESIDEGIELLSMANVYGARVDLSWADIETNGVFDITKSPSLYSINKLLEYNMKPIGMLWNPPIYKDETKKEKDEDFKYHEIPGSRGGEAGERQLSRWSDYITYVGTQMKGKIEYFEIWNEPNLGNFNYDLTTGDGYAYGKAVRTAAKAMKEVYPEAIVGGPSVTGISKEGTYDTEIGGKTFFEQAMEAGMWEDVKAVTFHPYVWRVTPEEYMQELEEGLNYYKQEYIKKGVEPPKLWSTEAGRFTAQSTVGTDKNKGALVCRQILLMKTHDLIDAPFGIFSFDRSGVIDIDQENTYGHVSSGAEGLEKYGTLYYPTEAFLSVAGMNYVMAESEFKEVLDTANVYMSRYWSDKFNQDIITLHTEKTEESIILNLGTDTVTLYDEYGNAEVINSNNGEFQFNVDTNVSYIVGDIPEFSVLYINNNNKIERAPNYSQTDISNIRLKIAGIGEKQNADFITYAVLYNGGRLAEVAKFTKSDLDENNEFVVSFETEKTSGDSIKIITVSDDGITPLCKALEFR